MMDIVSLSNAPKVPFDLEGYKMYTSDSLEVIHLCLKPGESIPQHANPFDVLACLISGEVTIHIGDDQRLLCLYDAVEVLKNLNRGFTNNGTSEARLLIMKKL
jgi:quercetin dioxygenase-like cupin family protein